LPPLPEAFERADALVSAHEHMASIDLADSGGVERVLEDVETQLAEVSVRVDAVETRLADIRAAIIRQYREGTVPPAESWLH
jgi:hypothetical protein